MRLINLWNNLRRSLFPALKNADGSFLFFAQLFSHFRPFFSRPLRRQIRPKTLAIPFSFPNVMQLCRCHKFSRKMLFVFAQTARICSRNHGIGMCSNLSIKSCELLRRFVIRSLKNLIIAILIIFWCVAQWQSTSNPTHKTLLFDTTMKNDRKTAIICIHKCETRISGVLAGCLL
jgi:hypothetical protein